MCATRLSHNRNVAVLAPTTRYTNLFLRECGLVPMSTQYTPSRRPPSIRLTRSDERIRSERPLRRCSSWEELYRLHSIVTLLAENSVSDQMERRIPVIEERARIDRETVERGVVRISTSVREHEEVLAEALRHEEVDIQRVAIDREVDAMPSIRQEGNVTVIPVVEERAVVTKRLVLVEELRVQRKTVQEVVQIPVTLHSTEISVERNRSPNGGQD